MSYGLNALMKLLASVGAGFVISMIITVLMIVFSIHVTICRWEMMKNEIISTPKTDASSTNQ